MAQYFESIPEYITQYFSGENSGIYRMSALQPNDWFAGVVTTVSDRLKRISAIYEALVSSITGSSEITEWITDHATMLQAFYADRTRKFSIDEVIHVGEDTANIIRAAFASAASELIDNNVFLNFSDSYGNVYSFSSKDNWNTIDFETIDGSIPFLDGENNLSMFIYPRNYSSISGLEVNDPGVTLYNSMRTIILRNNFPNPSGSTLVGMSKDICAAKNYVWSSILDFTNALASEEAVLRPNMRGNLTDVCTAEGRLTPWVDPHDIPPDDDQMNSVLVSTESRSTLYELFVDLGHASLINDTLGDITNAVGSDDPVSFLKQAYDRISNSVSAGAQIVKNMLDRAIQDAATSGQGGLISYLASYFRVQSTIVQEDGTIKYTDNTALIPKQFIAGLVVSTVSSIVEMVGLIITVIKPVIGILISGVSAVVKAISAGVSNAVDNKYPTTRGQQVQSINACLNAGPMALLRGTINYRSVNYQLISSLFMDDRSPKSFAVPGGFIVMGPGAFTKQGNITELIWEFHPRAFYMRDMVSLKSFDSDLRDMANWENMSIADEDYIVTSKTSYLKWNDPNYISRFWRNCIFNWDYGASGHNSSNSTVNQRIISGVTLSTFIFVMYCQSLRPALNSRPDLLSYVRPAFKHVTEGDPAGGLETIGFNASGALDLLYEAWQLDPNDCELSNVFFSSPVIWTKVIEYFVYAQEHNNVIQDAYMIWFSANDDSVIAVDQSDWPNSVTNVNLAFTDNQIRTGSQCIADVVSHPMRIDYEYKVPLYDPATTSFWIAASIAATAVGIAVTAVATVAVRKMTARRRATAIAKNAGARQTFTDAVNGVKTEVRSDGTIEQVSFDPKSQAGLEYVDNCWKDYKKNSMLSNMQSCVFGGTKFDVTSYYGDRDVSDTGDESVAFRSYNTFSSFTTASGVQDVLTSAMSGVSPLSNTELANKISRLITGYSENTD